MKKTFMSMFFVFAFILSSNLTAQSIGKIFNKAEADTIFGKVYYSQKIDAKLIQKVLDDTSSIAMFKVTKNKLMILDKSRKAIYPDTLKVSKDEPFYMYSKDKIKELFSKNKDNSDAVVEMRASTTTITSGSFTLEQATLCPPFCP